MPSSRFSGSFSAPEVRVAIDMGNPFLNRTVDGFLKIGTVAAARVATEETYHCLRKGSFSKNKLEQSLKKMCKEGAYWGTVAGVYVGTEYGVERIRGTRDWPFGRSVAGSSRILGFLFLSQFEAFYRFIEKNAMIGGAVSGALISAASNSSKDKVVVDAITGAAIATAAEFLNYLT